MRNVLGLSSRLHEAVCNSSHIEIISGSLDTEPAVQL
jgi:hypothetical protein